MRTVVFDIECDNLLDKITKIWVIAGIDCQTGERKVFTSEVCYDTTPDGSLVDGVKWIKTFDRIIAHNIMGYDYHVLEKFFPKLWNREEVPFSRVWDTFIQSKAQWFERPRIKGVRGNHGLEYYGELFKYPKPPIEDWSYWDEAKLNRVLVDIEINLKAFNYLNKQAQETGLDFTKQVRRTQATSYWYTKQELYGTKGDRQHMLRCVEELDEMIEELRQEVEPLLPPQLKVKAQKCTWEEIRDKWDGFFRKVPRTKLDENGKPTKNAYMPTTKVFLKSGKYDKHTANHFGISQEPSESDFLVGGPYTKIYFEDAKMSQHAVIKDYLLSIGWVPTQFNYEKNKDGSIARDDRGKMIPKSPKLTEDSFESIKGDLGQKIARYNTYVHRRRTFLNEKDDSKGWLNQLDSRGRIASGCMAWSTETSRAAQKGIVNVASNHALYGEPLRKAWVADKGCTLVSVDMDSAQLRLLANYMGDEDFTKAVLEGEEFDENHVYKGTDAHTFNSRFFGLIDDDDWQRAIDTQDQDLIHKISGARKKGKNGIYALLFGAGDAKFAQTVGYKTANEGAKVKENYYKRLPKVKQLQDRLLKQFHENKWSRGGYIKVAGDTWLYCGSEHKLLNYLLMGSEAQLQQQAVCWLNHQMRKRGMKGNQILSVHDELTCEVPLEEEGLCVHLMSEMYGVASKALGLEVLVTGTAQSGQNWSEIH